MTQGRSVRNVVVTGLGFVSSIGNKRATVTESLRGLRHGFARHSFFGGGQEVISVFGTIDDFEFPSQNYLTWKYPEEYQIPRDVRRSLCPHGVYVLCAVTQALKEAGLDVESVGKGRCGLHCASAGSPFMLHHYLSGLDRTQGSRGQPMGVVSSISGTLNFTLGAYLGIEGANCGFVSACASSAHALGYAFDEIALGRLDRVIVASGEDFSAESLLPFMGMRALSRNHDPDTASRPFDRARDGFVATGGGICLILEAEEIARDRGARPQARLRGWGQSADGYSPMISHPDGLGLVRAMRQTLETCGLEPGEIDYINAHATSTPAGDASEAKALRTVFPPEQYHPPISSTKALTGHPLSMAGALEAALSVIALDQQFIPGTAHLVDPDPLCDGLNLPRTTQNADFKTVLSNSSGFGGSNVCLVLERAEA